ncbi:AB-hydrolase YheT [Trametes gibbosa]|nr:AB-hydrolase YheT [Trametes gibbosa]
MAVYSSILTGSVLCVIYILWRRLSGGREPFVSLHTSATPESAVLTRSKGQRQAEPTVSFAQLIREKVPSLGLRAAYNDVWWLPGGDAQTMYSSIGDFTKVDTVVYERKFLQLPDQGIVTVDVSPPFTAQSISSAENVLLVAHGLTGGSHEAYVRAVLARTTPSKEEGGLGFRAVVLNFRGCNGSPVVTPRLYHAGSSDDIRHVVLWICHTFPGCRIYGIGFSLGANILAKYAGEEGDRCPLQSLVTLPWDFIHGARHLPSTFMGRTVYRYVLGTALARLLRLHSKVLMDAPNLSISRSALEDVLQRPRLTLKQYDEMVTAPLYGFKDAYEYYAQVSSSRVAKDIRIPCLGINSVDDPITGTGNLPLHELRENPWVVLAITQKGGHLGWFEYAPDGRITRWYVKPVTEFLAALVEYDPAGRPKPCSVVLDGSDFVRESGRDDVGFRVLSQEQSELVVSGAQVSKLFSGW